MTEEYGSNYYERGVETGESLYSNYRWIPELTIPLAATICEQLGIHAMYRVLDFGCAKGYLVKALRLLHRDAYGTELSEYARACVPSDTRPFVNDKICCHFTRNRTNNYQPFHWGLAKDVLEHLPFGTHENELIWVLKELRAFCGNLWVAVPLGDGNGKYVIPAMELDRTHRIREPLGWWADVLTDAGWYVESARHHMPYVCENWQKWPKGRGFFVCS